MADLCAAAGMSLPPLSRATQDELRRHIPDYLRVSNPVDNGGAPSGDERGRKILDAIVADPEIDAVIVPITGALASMSERFTQDLVDVQATTDKPIFVVWGSPLFEDYYSQVLAPNGVPVFRTFSNCVRAARAWFDYWDAQQRWVSPFAKPVTRRSAAAARVRPLLRPGSALSEHESKAVLGAYGIPVTRDVAVPLPGGRHPRPALPRRPGGGEDRLGGHRPQVRPGPGAPRRGQPGGDAAVLGRLHGHRRHGGEGGARRRRARLRDGAAGRRDHGGREPRRPLRPGPHLRPGRHAGRGVRRCGRAGAALRPPRGPTHDRRLPGRPGAGGRPRRPAGQGRRRWST